MTTAGKHMGGVRTLEDLHSRCIEVGECWEWQQYINRDNQPQVQYDGMPRPVRRVAWQMANGAVPQGKNIVGMCGNHRCINPSHSQPMPGSAVLHKNFSGANEGLRRARISATKRAQGGVSAEVVATVNANPCANAKDLAKRLGVHTSTIYKLRKQQISASPWAGLMGGA